MIDSFVYETPFWYKYGIMVAGQYRYGKVSRMRVLAMWVTEITRDAVIVWSIWAATGMWVE